MICLKFQFARYQVSQYIQEKYINKQTKKTSRDAPHNLFWKYMNQSDFFQTIFYTQQKKFAEKKLSGEFVMKYMPDIFLTAYFSQFCF